MKCTSAAIIISLWAISTSATVSKGTTTFAILHEPYHSAWIEGDDPCDKRTDIASADQALCSKTFELDNNESYAFFGCGTSGFALYNEPSGSFNHACKYTPQKINCPNGDVVQKEWKC